MKKTVKNMHNYHEPMRNKPMKQRKKQTSTTLSIHINSQQAIIVNNFLI